MVLNNKGFSLIELIIAMALVAMVTAVAYGVYISGITSFSRESANVSNQAGVRQALSYISKEIRKANEVNISGDTLILDGFEYELVDNIIKKDNNNMFYNIAEFSAIKDGTKLKLEIMSTPNPDGENIR